MLDLLIKNGSCYIDKDLKDQDIAIKDNKIIEIGKIDSEAKEIFDAKNLTVLPGCIDTQTHFREPGSTDTEDLHSGSRAAIAGGITSVFEMPNTNPPTSTKVEFQKKLDLAKNRMYCNYAFYFGATADNANELADLENLEGCCGIKLFAGSSTGNLLVAEEKDIERVFQSSSKVVAVGLTVLPGCFSTQTHFREPGSTDTEDLYSGSRAAIVGGITSVLSLIHI